MRGIRIDFQMQLVKKLWPKGSNLLESYELFIVYLLFFFICFTDGCVCFDDIVYLLKIVFSELLIQD